MHSYQMRSLLKLTPAVLAITSCAQVDAERILFCDASGAELAGHFFNLKTEALVMGDVIFEGEMDCREGHSFCFNSAFLQLNIPRTPQSVARVPWNDLQGNPWSEWIYDPQTKLLSLREPSTGWKMTTCSP